MLRITTLIWDHRMEVFNMNRTFSQSNPLYPMIFHELTIMILLVWNQQAMTIPSGNLIQLWKIIMFILYIYINHLQMVHFFRSYFMLVYGMVIHNILIMITINHYKPIELQWHHHYNPIKRQWNCHYNPIKQPINHHNSTSITIMIPLSHH